MLATIGGLDDVSYGDGQAGACICKIQNASSSKSKVKLYNREGQWCDGCVMWWQVV
jgi:hypothetical protein